MLLMDSARHAGCSPVCLDLSVGLPTPPPRRNTAMEDDTEPVHPAGGRAASPMTDEEASKALLEAKLSQVSEENRRLTEMIAHLYASHVAASPASPPATGTKRGRESPPSPTSHSCDAAVSAPLSDGGASCKRIKVSTKCTRIDPADTTLTVRDGYHWRKYGQKVTRDNPSPRAYFRCAFAPSCPVKKKVQRSAEDSSLLVATYEGEHNHQSPATARGGGAVPCSIAINSSGPTITLDLTKNNGGVRVLDGAEAPHPEPEPDLKKLCREVASPEFRTALVEQMASALTSDSNFTGALAAAILRQLPEF